MNVPDIFSERYGLKVKLLLSNYGEDVDAILDEWQKESDSAEDIPDLLAGCAEKSGMRKLDAVDCAYYDIADRIKSHFFRNIPKDAVELLFHELYHYGVISLLDGCEELTWNAYTFRDEWRSYNSDDDAIGGESKNG